jgi:hypothetical protein
VEKNVQGWCCGKGGLLFLFLVGKMLSLGWEWCSGKKKDGDLVKKNCVAENIFVFARSRSFS